jgi:predicted O-linked N-acetylglucosamine transferase (SPINDLY family)
VTLAGKLPQSRSGASLLHAIGLDELVATSQEQYVEIALNLARDREKLGAMRAGMRKRMQVSPLMDGAGFTRALEASYRSIWRMWCDGNPR